MLSSAQVSSAGEPGEPAIGLKRYGQPWVDPRGSERVKLLFWVRVKTPLFGIAPRNTCPTFISSLIATCSLEILQLARRYKKLVAHCNYKKNNNKDYG